MQQLIGTTERRLPTFAGATAASPREAERPAPRDDSQPELTVLPLAQRRARSPGAVVDSLPRAPRPRPSGTIRR